MDSSAFDMLVRSFARAENRRRLLTAVAVLPLGGILSPSNRDDAAAEHPNQHLGHRTQQRKRKQRNKKNNNKNNNKNTNGGGAQPGPGSQACDVCPTCRYKNLLAALRDFKGPTTIRICPGTYYGPFPISRALTLIGSGQGTGAGDTILKTQGTGSGSVITIQQSDPLKQPPVGPVTLQSLRITGGGGDREGGFIAGGGVNHLGTSLTMTDCTITDNHVGDPARNLAGQGGGVLIGGFYHPTATLTNCTISGNTAIASQGLGGGGGIVNGGTLTLNNTSVTENASTGGTGGGGIGNAGTLVLNNSSVTGNTATGGFQNGGGILNLGGSVTLQNGSSVTGNTPDNCVGTPGCSS